MAIRMQGVKITPHDLQRRLASFEERYSMPSARFYEAFLNGRLTETDDFHVWSRTYAAWCRVSGDNI